MPTLVSRYLRKRRHFREDTRQGHRLGAIWARGLVGSMAHDAELDRAATGSSSTTDVPGGGLQPRSLLYFFDQTDDPLAVCFMPVALPPGLFISETRPDPTGSSPTTNTIGMLAVAVFALTAAGGACARMSETGRRTGSAAMAGRRSYWSSAYRYSIVTF